MEFLRSLAVLAMVIVPGTGFALAVYRPGEVGLALRLALSVAGGIVVTGGIAFLLAVVHLLHAATFLPLVAAAAAALWALAVRRAPIGQHGAAIAREIRADPWALIPGLVLIVAIGVVRATYSPVHALSNPTVWRYWADGVEVADAGHVASHVLQYGRVIPPVINKVFLTSLIAGVVLEIGRNPFPGLAALTWLGAFGFALALWAVGRELGLRTSAALLAVLAIGKITVGHFTLFNSELSGDLAILKAETFGRLVAFAGVAMAIRAMRMRSRGRDALLAGGLLGVASAIHSVPVMIAAAMLACVLAGRLILGHDRLRVLASAGVVVASVAVVAAAALLLPHGDLGLRGTTGAGAYAGFPASFDPTLFVHSGTGPEAQVATRSYGAAPKSILRTYALSATGLSGRSRLSRHIWPIALALLFGGFVFALALMRWGPEDLRITGLVAWGLGVAIMALTWYFSHRYRLYIPALFGFRRLFDYSSLPLLIGGLAAGEIAVALLSNLRPIRPWVPLAATVVVLALAAAALPGARSTGPTTGDGYELQAVNWIRGHVPCDARILTNQHTEGAFEALTGRVALLEGATPYLRPDVLRPIVGLFLDARAYFRDPEAGHGFLRSQGVTYVAVIGPGGLGYKEPVGDVNLLGLDRAEDLRMVYLAPSMTIWQVRDPVPAAGAPDSSTFPGYRCGTSPLRP